MGERRGPSLRERALEARGHKFPCPATVKGKKGRRMSGQASAIKPRWLSFVSVICFHMDKGAALSVSLGYPMNVVTIVVVVKNKQMEFSTCCFLSQYVHVRSEGHWHQMIRYHLADTASTILHTVA